MQMYRFGRKLKLAATAAIKHQIRKLMLEDAVKQAQSAERRSKAPEPKPVASVAI
jgi:hypothetical protein